MGFGSKFKKSFGGGRNILDHITGGDSKSGRLFRELNSSGLNEWVRKAQGKESHHDDLLFGKKSQDVPADLMASEIRRVQKAGIRSLDSGLADTLAAGQLIDPRKQASLAIAGQEKKALSDAINARKGLEERIQSRGIGRSAQGLNAQVDKKTTDRIGNIRGQRPELERGIERGKFDTYLSAGGQVAKAQDMPVQMRAVKGQRKGGIANILGGALGG